MTMTQGLDLFGGGGRAGFLSQAEASAPFCVVSAVPVIPSLKILLEWVNRKMRTGEGVSLLIGP